MAKAVGLILISLLTSLLLVVRPVQIEGRSAMKKSVLILDRFCGQETYPIVESTWNLYDSRAIDSPNLCLSIKAGAGTNLHDDTKELNAEPSWEINLVERDLTLAALVKGARFLIPLGYDKSRGGHVTNFYYCDHEGTDNNSVEILEVDGDRLRVRMVGELNDVTFYDGSKPKTKLSVDAWFIRDQSTVRSVQ